MRDWLERPYEIVFFFLFFNMKQENVIRKMSEF